MSHLHAFLLCTLLGFFGGALYDLLSGLVYPFKSRVLTALSEGLFCLLFAGCYLWVSLEFALPAFRFYHFLGCTAGFCLYLKSLHKTVAFFAEKVYNAVVEIIQKRGKRKCRKEAKVFPKKKPSASR